MFQFLVKVRARRPDRLCGAGDVPSVTLEFSQQKLPLGEVLEFAQTLDLDLAAGSTLLIDFSAAKGGLLFRS